MDKIFERLIISCPNDGGLFLAHGGRVRLIDSLHCTGLDAVNETILRGIQPNGLSLTGDVAWDITGQDLPFDDIHDALIVDDTYYIVSTMTNEVIQLDRERKELKRWSLAPAADSLHVNCLALWNGRIIYSAFGDFDTPRGYKGCTYLAGFVRDLSTGDTLIKELSQPHSLTPLGDRILIANSEKKELLLYGSDGTLLKAKTLDGYTRGICIGKNHIYVGLSCSRNIEDDTLPSATLVAIDKESWEIRARLALPTREIYAVKQLDDDGTLLNALASINEQVVLRLSSEVRKDRIANAELSNELTRLEGELQKKDDCWSARVGQVAEDFRREISRIAEERDGFLAQKDADWSARVEQVARDYDAEISRIASERDHLLTEKDRKWLQRLAQCGDEFALRMTAISQSHAEELRSIRAEGKAREDKFQETLQNVASKVSVVTVNFNGKRFLNGLLDSLAAQTFPPTEIIVVDNASTDGSVDFLREFYPHVRIVESTDNIGFAGGNNLGVERAKYPLIALINNDTVVDPYWLEHLIGAWTRCNAGGERVGAVAPKIRFLKRFVKLQLSAPTFVPGDSDQRTLGVAVDLTRTGFVDLDYIKPIAATGFHQEERWPDGRIVRWTTDSAQLMLPVPDCGPLSDVLLSLSVCRPAFAESVELTVQCGDCVLGVIPVSENFVEFTLQVPSTCIEKATWVINNAGSRLDKNGNASDIGINEPDHGQYDQPSELTAFCGCSALIPRSEFLRLKGFDSRFFMYYEDVDLAWRMRKAGLKIVYEPRAIVRHIHAGSSGEWSPRFRYHVTRNYWINRLKNSNPARFLLAAMLLSGALVRRWRIALRRTTDHRWKPAFEALDAPEIETLALRHAFSMIPSIMLKRGSSRFGCNEAMK